MMFWQRILPELMRVQPNNRSSDDTASSMVGAKNTSVPADEVRAEGEVIDVDEVIHTDEDTHEHEDTHGYGVAEPEERPPAPLGTIRTVEDPNKRDQLLPHELEERQISIWGLFVIVTAVSVVLAPVSFLPLSTYTAILGVLVFLLFLLSTLLGAKELIVRATLWTLLGVYLVTLLIACADHLGI